ncbi:MAG TPA: esterase-like activity of phytase family protein [Kofleriaceae bacterium]|nr:esterase-like activity of phytase family protein [Kofleriaceae bacterium]
MRARPLLLVTLAACGATTEQPLPAEHARAPAFVEVRLATAPGLSGLASDDNGALWTVTERARTAYRITLDAALHPTLEPFRIEGGPDGYDLEAIAVLGDGAFAFGTENQQPDVATIQLATLRDHTLAVTNSITITAKDAGIPLDANHGAEGVCGRDTTVIAALESWGTHPRRWAPLLRIVDGVVVRAHRLWLTSDTGRISSLDCTLDPDGTVHAIAIERHFEVSRVLAFTLRRDAPDAIEPTLLLDLGAELRGKANLEGIARLADGRLVAVVDNQWKTIDGESRLIVFPRSP